MCRIDIALWFCLCSVLAASTQAQQQGEDNVLSLSQAERLNRSGIAHFRTGDYLSALTTFSEALELSREAGDFGGESRALTEIGMCHEGLGEYHKALDSLFQALKVQRRIVDKQGETYSLSAIGNIYRRWGYPEVSFQHLHAALALCNSLQQCPALAKIVNELGLAHFAERNYKKALRYYRQALALYRSSNDELNVGITLNNIGAAYNGIGHFSDAIPWLAEANSLAQHLGNDELLASSLSNIGFSHAQLHETDQAEQSYREALAAFRRLGARQHEFDLLKRLELISSGVRPLQ